MENLPGRVGTNTAVFHEIKVTLVGSFLVNVIWWLAVNVLGIIFPLMHFLLVFGACAFLPVYDRIIYPNEPPISVYVTRAMTDVILFFLGLVIIGPVGVFVRNDVPIGIFNFFMAFIAISTILSVMRAAINIASILTKYFT